MKLAIAVGMLVLLGLPFACSDRPFAVSAAERAGRFLPGGAATLPGAADQWLDFLKTLVGAFAGAGAAFYANDVLQRRSRFREEKAGGNLAMTTIGQSYIDFLQVQRMMREEVARRDELAPGVPLWLTFRPPVHFLPLEHKFEYKAVAFLFEGGHVKAFEALHFIETIHRDLIGHSKKFAELNARKQEILGSAEREKRLAAAKDGVKVDETMKVGDARLLLGPLLIVELEQELETLLDYAARYETLYLGAAKLLRVALISRFGPDGIVDVRKPTTNATIEMGLAEAMA